MTVAPREVLEAMRFGPVTAADIRDTGDYLNKIVDLIRGCGFGVAIYSDQTPPRARWASSRSFQEIVPRHPISYALSGLSIDQEGEQICGEAYAIALAEYQLSIKAFGLLKIGSGPAGGGSSLREGRRNRRRRAS